MFGRVLGCIQAQVTRLQSLGNVRRGCRKGHEHSVRAACLFWGWLQHQPSFLLPHNRPKSSFCEDPPFTTPDAALQRDHLISHSTLPLCRPEGSEHIHNLFHRNGACVNHPVLRILRTRRTGEGSYLFGCLLLLHAVAYDHVHHFPSEPLNDPLETALLP